MNIVKVIDGVVTPYSRSKLKQDNPQVSFPLVLTPEILTQYELYEFVSVQPPEHNPDTEKVVEADPELVNGVYEQRWEVVPLTEQELALRAAQERQSPENIRALLEALGRIATRDLILQNQLSPEDVETLAGLYPVFASDMPVSVDQIYNFEGVLYKVIQAHTTQVNWTPPTVPALFAPVVAAGVVPEWVQPQGQHDSYALGDHVTRNGRLWESAVSSNVWTPGEYGWTDLGPA